MTELEKAQFILEILNQQNFDVDIKEAFRLTQSYSWYFQLVNTLKENEENKK